jgi:hypothetical protein
MIASHRDGEITYYEELGIAPDASPEQIRDAFRLNVRLLHPDQQTDPQLKEIAEKQMRKLNRIYATLSDPDRRSEYNEMLDEEFAPPLILNSPSANLRKLTSRLAWMGAIVISAGLLMWLASDNTPAVQSRAPDVNPSAAAQPSSTGTAAAETEAQSSRELGELRAELRSAIIERDAATHELDRLRRSAPAPRPTPSTPLEGPEVRPPVTITELPAASRLPAFTSAPLPRSGLSRTDKPVNRQMGGFWFYAKPPQGQINKNKTLYPPEYIETTITEDGSSIHGSFRARYVIVDRAISPDVDFTFTGTQNGLQVSCPWTGSGGSKGDLTLRLTSENSMRLDWTASELGALGLSSGTAVLTRRIE